MKKSEVNLVSIFGEKLKRLREEKGLTQENIARRLCISRATVSKYESGRRKPDIETMKTLSKYYGVSVDYIIGMTETAAFSSIDEDDFKSDCNNTEDPDNITKDEDIFRLAVKIKKHNLDLNILEDIIDNILLLVNRKKNS